MPARPARFAALLAAVLLVGCDGGASPSTTSPSRNTPQPPAGSAAAAAPGDPLSDEQAQAIAAFIEEAEASISASESKLQGVQLVANQLNDDILGSISEMWNERILGAKDRLDQLRTAGSNNAEQLKADVQFFLLEAEQIDRKAMERLKMLRTPGN